MSSKVNLQKRSDTDPWLRLLLVVLLGAGVVVALGAAYFVRVTGLSAPLSNLIQEILALQSQQVTWYITRAAGWTAYLLLWLSTVWGLAMPAKSFDKLLQRTYTYDFHEILSLLALGFTGVHMVILMFDHFMPYSLLQLINPFLSNYRPFWMGVGGIAMYLSVLVSATFYLRKRIGVKNFRIIHYTSLIAYFTAVLHGFFSGSDTSLPAAQVIYIGSFLVVVFMTVYWLVMGIQKKGERSKVAASQTSMTGEKVQGMHGSRR